MGTLKPHKPSEENGWSPFNDYVEQRPGVCDNCYSKTHETVVEYDPLKLKQSLRGVLSDEVEKTKFADSSYGQNLSSSSLHSYPTSYGTRKSTFCKNCGSDRKMVLEGSLPDNYLEDIIKKAYNRTVEIEGLYLNKPDFIEEERKLRDGPEEGEGHRRIIRKAVDNTVKINHDELPDHDRK